ncbi:TolC family outer membrane protein [Pseudomaricurvus sp. HS19]|uniref:TolC family outer membrane protein n=1 Tax=Pseudomaricurvus sp. HS19 TaxID=2692626 RepID=UPI00351A5F0D
MNKFSKVAISASFMLAGVSQSYGLTLQEAVDTTLQTNPEVLATRNEYLSRSAEVKQAKSDYLPTVELGAGLGRQSLESPGTGGDEVTLTRQEASISARQLLFDGFATSSEIERQSARSDSAAFKVQEAEENTSLRVAEAYLNLMRYNELLTLARETLYEHQNIHDQMVLRNKSGVGSKADLDQISARLALAYSNTIAAQSNLLDARTNFYRVTGLSPNLDELSMPGSPSALPSSLAAAEELALKQHPTLQSATADVESAEAQYRASESNYWPRLQLEADKRWDENIDGVEGDRDDLIVAVRLTYNLYNGGGDKARRSQTAHLAEQSRDVRNNTHRQVVESLRLSWSAYQTITEQMKYLQMHVESALNTKASYNKQFDIGRRTLLDLLNTENEVVDAKRALVNARFDHLFSQYRIFNSMGRLLQELGNSAS